MIPIKNFVEYVKKGIVPPGPPEKTENYNYFPYRSYYDPIVEARFECIEYGMWPIVDKYWTKILADWIGSRKCLEIMAGAGWISYALSAYGTECIATDDFSWDEKHSKINRVFPVKLMDAVQSVKYFTKSEILLVSWPPYGDDIICKACEAWGKNRPIVYIGEDSEGCTAPDEFWKHFNFLENMPNIPMRSWYGLRDRVYIGCWAN